MTDSVDEQICETEIQEDVISLEETQNSYSADDSQEILSMNNEEPLGDSDGFISMHQMEIAKGNSVYFAVLGFDGKMVVKIDGVEKQYDFTERADEESWGYEVITEGLDVGKHVLSIDVTYSQYGHKSKSFTFEIKDIVVTPPSKIIINGYTPQLDIQIPANGSFNKLNIYVNGKK